MDFVFKRTVIDDINVLKIFDSRKMAKNAGQFKTLVTSARKGAAAGSKIRVMKGKK